MCCFAADQVYGDQEMHATVRKQCIEYLVRVFFHEIDNMPVIIITCSLKSIIHEKKQVQCTINQ